MAFYIETVIWIFVFGIAFIAMAIKLTHQIPQPTIDYAKINRIETELGMVQSDYSQFGVPPTDVVAETNKFIAEIDYKLLSEDERTRRELEKRVVSAHAIPSHQLGSYITTRASIDDHMKRARTEADIEADAKIGRRIKIEGNTVNYLQPMDAPDPIMVEEGISDIAMQAHGYKCIGGSTSGPGFIPNDIFEHQQVVYRRSRYGDIWFAYIKR